MLEKKYTNLFEQKIILFFNVMSTSKYLFFIAIKKKNYKKDIFASTFEL